MNRFESLERATRRRERGDTWTDDQFRDARERDLAERTRAIGPVVRSTLTCLLLATLLTSGKIVEIAEREELGEWRDRHLAVAEGVDRVANFLSLNRPYDLIQDIRGTGEDAGERVDTLEEVEALLPTTTLPATTTVDPTVTTTSDPGDTSTSTSTTTTTTTVPVGPIRTVTADEPLTIYVAGDSQAEYLGQAITTENGDRALEVEVEDRISTSLARPDYFNWPAEIAATRDRLDPEAVVLFIGANDHQDMADADGNRLVEGTPEWQAEWADRLELTLDLLEADHRHVFWVTQPPMRDSEVDEGIEMINALAEPVIAARPWVSAIEIWELFGGEAGYSQRVTHPDGRETSARVTDGVHLTRSASSWVAELVFASMDGVWAFE